MTVAPFFVGILLIFLAAFFVYGKFLSRGFALSETEKTPAHTLEDGMDYVPTKKQYLLGQHFSAIAAAGPIVGPIVAAIYFGWLPAVLWIVLGSIFIGAMHDFSSLAGSIRHRAASVAEMIKIHMSKRAYYIFLTYVWFAMIYIIVAFTDITARAFVDSLTLADGTIVDGGGVATASVLYLFLGVAMGLCVRFWKWPLWLSTIVFVPLVGLVIWYGQKIPIHMIPMGGDPARTWDYIILIYCGLASVVPVWALLQPRGYLGGYFLYGTLLASFIGILVGGFHVQYPAFITFESAKLGPLFPMLFITIACGACSGFHGIVCSGTTSKQLDKETDAHLIGYGAMLLEGVVAIIALITVMVLAQGSTEAAADPNLIYARGIGNFLGVFGVSPTFAVSFGLLAFTTFVYDTLDVATRLGRYIFQELTGWQGGKSAFFATVATLIFPMFFMSSQWTDENGNRVAAWKIFWTIFGASNQLLAGLTLLGLTIWLLRTGKKKTAWVTGIPMIFMMTMTLWSLFWIAKKHIISTRGHLLDPVGFAALVLIGLSGLLLYEGLRVFLPAQARRKVI